MRVVVQRVTKASVTVGDELISSIGRGLCVLVGICRDDTPKEREYLARKVQNLRVFDDENGKRWCKSVKDKNFEILCVSQFTLYSVMKGNKPDFHNAMPGEESKQYYDDFLAILRKGYNSEKIKDGKFAAYMQVHIQNDGPVTIQLEAVPDIHFQIPESRVGPRAASGSKTPVAVVRGQPQDRTIEKATSYIAIFTSAFNGETSKQEEFLKVLQEFTQGNIHHMPELILSAVDILQEDRQLLCGFSGFLPQGFSIFLENEDLEQIRIRCPAVEDMSIKELRDHVEELKSNEASASPVPLTKPTRAMEELILQLSRLLSS
ncbi:uncharacterized protein [Apostichopus japonicus]|uniref:uncharacterized protein n=1 Tax=Stichopus japonicus TaxID=307972 RepID=UPI003AB4F336